MSDVGIKELAKVDASPNHTFEEALDRVEHSQPFGDIAILYLRGIKRKL